MNFYYSLNDAQARPQFLGNFEAFHRAESELCKLLGRSLPRAMDGYLFLHKSALPWRDQDVNYLGPFRLVRIISTRKPRKIGSAGLFMQVLENDYLADLPKAS